MGQPHQSDPKLGQRLEPDQSVMQKFEALHTLALLLHSGFKKQAISVSFLLSCYFFLFFFPDPTSVEVNSAARAGLWHQEPIAA